MLLTFFLVRRLTSPTSLSRNDFGLLNRFQIDFGARLRCSNDVGQVSFLQTKKLVGSMIPNAASGKARRLYQLTSFSTWNCDAGAGSAAALTLRSYARTLSRVAAQHPRTGTQRALGRLPLQLDRPCGTRPAGEETTERLVRPHRRMLTGQPGRQHSARRRRGGGRHGGCRRGADAMGCAAAGLRRQRRGRVNAAATAGATAAAVAADGSRCVTVGLNRRRFALPMCGTRGACARTARRGWPGATAGAATRLWSRAHSCARTQGGGAAAGDRRIACWGATLVDRDGTRGPG